MKKNDCIEAVRQTWVNTQRHYVHFTLPCRFQVQQLTWFLGLRYFFMPCNVECFIASNSTLVLVFFTSLQNIVNFVNNSHSMCRCQKHKCRMGPHNGTYNLCVFAISSKTGFVDIVPLCCKPPMVTLKPKLVVTLPQYLCTICTSLKFIVPGLPFGYW